VIYCVAVTLGLQPWYSDGEDISWSDVSLPTCYYCYVSSTSSYVHVNNVTENPLTFL